MEVGVRGVRSDEVPNHCHGRAKISLCNNFSAVLVPFTYFARESKDLE